MAQTMTTLLPSGLGSTSLGRCRTQRPAAFGGKVLSASFASQRNQAISSVRQSALQRQLTQRPALARLDARRSSLQCTAAAAAGDSAVPATKSEGGFGSTVVLGALFGTWYLFNIFFNIYNKQVLKAFPYPITVTVVQFGVGSLIALTMWTLGLHEKPKIDFELIKQVTPLAFVHTLGNLLTNISLGKVAVSFTHTIKAMEPFFSVLLSSMFLGEKASLPVILTLFPIVGGVGMASLSEATFNWPGFLAAMGSNVTFQSRNVLSKKFMGKVKGSLDNINLFSLITIISFFLLLPVALLTEGVKFTPGAMRALGVNPDVVIKQSLLAALCFHGYQQVSYMILQRVSPVTHSIGNCLKRVIVIIASVIFFKNPMGQQNMIGTAIALAGVFAYSQVKRLSGKKKASA